MTGDVGEVPGSAGVPALLRAATERFAAAGLPSPRVDAEILLAHVLRVPRSRLPLLDDPTVELRATFERMVGRRAAGEPLQHIIGRVVFRHSELLIGPGAFVPRPETELVAGAAIEYAASAASTSGTTDQAGTAEKADTADRAEVTVVDLGTGSGAIALAVSTELAGARVYACELDPDAYVWAERNLGGTGVHLVLDDLAVAFGELDGTVDVVVSNPPYIPLEAYEQVPAEVRLHDPAMALWSGQDGLDAIRAVERTAARLLRPGGRVVVEHADQQGESAPAVFAASGSWSDVRDHPDLNSRPRFVTATRVGIRGAALSS